MIRLKVGWPAIRLSLFANRIDRLRSSSEPSSEDAEQKQKRHHANHQMMNGHEFGVRGSLRIVNEFRKPLVRIR